MAAAAGAGAAAADAIDVKAYAKYTTLAITRPAQHVLQIELNRPQKRNAMNRAFWREMREVIEQTGADRNVRAVVLSAAGAIFSAGLDLSDHGEDFFGGDATGGAGSGADTARKALTLRQNVLAYQNAFNGFGAIPQPIIAAVHSACVGGGVDLICAADIRVCSADAWFCIKEVDIAMAADVGTFPRLLKVTGNDSLVRELAFTGRNLPAKEALSMGLVSSVCADRAATIAHAVALAKSIAAKSPVAIAGIKHIIGFGREHSTADALQYVATWNMAALQSQDVVEAVGASLQKRTPIFSKL
eukprot:gnl/Spiro4/16272_TR8740_c0_g1_i1.p2 gnl/Spiro4/16272_TR8740_c0_g1~~gnl/Spiro4/16272_TR8740_c0_g1_i1.p2  ORF type:complete len:322 (-),score=107.74 gnl/Spiro4/16272_TR8740_c0_g1_i1:75-977(-)